MEKIYCHYQDVGGVCVEVDPPRVFTVSETDRVHFDEFATNWAGPYPAGVFVTDEITGVTASIFKASCGLGCECAAIFQLRTLSVTVNG